MKLDLNTGIDTRGGDVFKEHNFRFDDEFNGHIFKSVTTYSNPIGSVVREITSNCFDSHKRAGVTRDVEIAIIDSNKLSGQYDRIEFRDFGTGLSEKQVEQIFTVVGASDKRSDNSEIGGFGLGSKSPFGYIRDLDGINTFEVDTWYDGTHTKYSLMETNDGPKMIELFSHSDDRTNGTTVSVPIGPYDKSNFKNEIKNQLAYFDNIKYINCGVESTDYRVYKGENFVYRTDRQPHNRLHVCLGKVAYPLDFSQIEHDNSYDYNSGHSSYTLGAPLGLYFEIGDIDVTPTRESLLYNDKTIKAIDNKIDDLAEELQEKYKENFESVKTIEDYIDICRNGKSVVSFNGIKVPISYGLVDNKNQRYPKYDDIQDLIPTKTYSIFQQYRNYKIVNSDGHIFQGSSNNDITWLLDNCTDKTFLVSTKYQTKKNKFMCSSHGENLSGMYLVRKDTHEPLNSYYKGDSYNGVDFEDMTDEQKDLLGFLKFCNHISNDVFYQKTDDISFDHIRLLKQFFEEVDEYVEGKFRNYDDIEITEEYEEYLSEKRKKKRQKKKEKREESFPIKYIDYKNYNLEFKWSISQIKYDHLNNNSTYIYGFSEDDEKLLNLGPFWYHKKNTYKSKINSNSPYVYDHGLCRLNIIKIAMSREDLFKDLDNAYHVDEWMKKKYHHSFFMKPTMSRWLYDNYKSYNLSIPWIIREIGLFDEYMDCILNKFDICSSCAGLSDNPIYQDIVDYYDWDSDPLNMPNPYGKSIRITEGIQYIIDEKLYLLNHITSSNNLKKLLDHVKKYVKSQGFESNINPELYYRLKRYKENNYSN